MSEKKRKAWQERDPRKVVEGLKEAAKAALFVAQPFRTHGIPGAPILQELEERGYDVALVSPGKESQSMVARNYRLPYIPAGDAWSADPEVAARLAHTLNEEGNDKFNEILFRDYFATSARAMYPKLKALVEEIGPDKVKLVTDCSDFATKMVGETLGVDVTTFDNGLVPTIMENWTEHIRPVLNEIRAEFGLPAEPEERPAGYDKLWVPDPPELLLDGANLPDAKGYQRAVAKRMGEGVPEGVFDGTDPKVYGMTGSSGWLSESFGPRFEAANKKAIGAMLLGGYQGLIPVGSEENVRKFEQYAREFAAEHGVEGNLGKLTVVSYADQPAALERADAFIWHGGRGGFGEMLRAETPIVGIPQFADQQWNTKKAAEHGMGLSYDSADDATPEGIRERLDEIIAHPEKYQAAVEDWHARMMELPTLGQVIDQIAGPAEAPGGTLPASSSQREVITVSVPEAPVATEDVVSHPDGGVVEGVIIDRDGEVVEGVTADVEAPEVVAAVEAPEEVEVVETPAEVEHDLELDGPCDGDSF